MRNSYKTLVKDGADVNICQAPNRKVQALLSRGWNRNMSATPNLPKKSLKYPEQTSGGKFAAEARKLGNELTESQREELFKRGMQVIYGGSGDKETARARH